MFGERVENETTITQPPHRAEERMAMEGGLFRQSLLIATLAGCAVTLREVLTKSLSGPVLATTLLSAALAFAPGLWRTRIRVVGPLFFSTLVLLLSQFAISVGGARAPALSLAFIPGFLATLVLGRVWGWVIAAEMLVSLAWLGRTTVLPDLLTELRFANEVVMTLFAAGLAHSLVRSFASYERLIERRQASLAALERRRFELVQAIYEELGPVAQRLPNSLLDTPPGDEPKSSFDEAFDELAAALLRAKQLANQELSESAFLTSSDPDIRRNTMRTWLRLGALLNLFFTVRNAIVGETVLAPLFLIGVCAGFDFWLSRATRDRPLELTALALGVATSSTIFFHIPVYGRTPNIPVLVMAPAAVLFTALLSRGPATWIVIALNCGVLTWTATGQTLTLAEIRLVGDLGVSFLVVAIALGSVFSLRAAYARTLIAQAEKNAEALRRHRRLAGTLFHDASNHLQAILLYMENKTSSADLESARALSIRIEWLVSRSQQFLTDSPSLPPFFTDLRLADAFLLISEAFLPRLRAKRLSLVLQGGEDVLLSCDPDLFVESVLGNLVSNATKFSPPDRDIRISAMRTEDEVGVVVDDDGPGFPPEILEARGGDDALPSRPGTKGEPGQGYGLRLAEEHVRRMNGRLEVMNRPEGGARCIVWLKSGADGPIVPISP